MPGINRFYYDRGEYWPSHFDTITDPETIGWLEERLYMVTLWPRPEGFDVLSETYINDENVKSLATAADLAWEGLTNKDMDRFSEGFLDSFRSQVRMFPKMLTPEIERIIRQYHGKARAWKLSGAGGGGYLVLVSEEEIPNSFKVKIRLRELGF